MWVPLLVLVSIPEPWVVGAVIRNPWSFVGDNERLKVNLFLIAPFVNYNFPQGWHLTSPPPITANREAEGKGKKWTIPIGGGFGKVFRIGKLPFNGNVGTFSNVVRPDGTADWTLRMQLSLLLPKSMFSN